jgi:DnaJ like chaperone protein
MARYAKWLGGGLGWALGGPIGAILGFALGAIYESMNKGKNIQKAPEYEYGAGRRRPTTTPGDFQASLIILAAAVMKADGRHLRSELDFVKSFLRRNFRSAEVEEMLQLLRQVLEQDFDVKPVAEQIRHFMDYAARLQLLHFLFGLSNADNEVHPREIDVIIGISGQLGIKSSDSDSILAMFKPDTDSAYRVLEIDPSASDDEVRKAYRRMAAKYHPDKVAHVGEDVQEAAKRKFQDLQLAYGKIKKQRGLV